MRRFVLSILVPTIALAVVADLGAQVTGVGVTGGQLGLSGPSIDSTGSWGQVLSVTPKWLVIQTADFQQFPIALDSVGLFVIRWPTTPAMIADDAWAEVTGLDLGGNQVVAAQVDVYEGASRNLVTPISQTIVGYNRVITQTNPFTLGTFNYFQLLPGEELMPRRRHAVGPLVSRDPMAIAVTGNDALVILPTGAGLTVTQVTPGSSSFARAGDLVYFVPTGFNPRSLLIGQLILYKGVPLEQFVP
jgi:hypothetical protein